jgi:hypothetical protein
MVPSAPVSAQLAYNGTPKPEYRTSFTKDADGSYNLEGGWFDCGDHVLFGQTFFYSAYVLAKLMNHFPPDFMISITVVIIRLHGEWKLGYIGGTPNGIPICSRSSNTPLTG